MDPKALDQLFFPLTDHEKEYKKGLLPTNYKNYPYVNKHGQMVLKSIYNLTPDLLIKSPHIVVKRHSRFQSYPDHFHDWVEINYMYSGTCRQIINGQYYQINKGQVLLIDSDTVHSVEPLGEEDILMVIIINKDFFDSNFFNRLDSSSTLSSFFINTITEGTVHENFIIFHSENNRRLSMFMNEFFCEWFDPSPRSNEILNSLFSVVILELINIYENAIETSTQYLKKNSIIPILRYIEKNYRTCTLPSTASFFNLNPNYLSNLLKKHTGKSFIELLHQQKISSAKTLLSNSSMSVQEIANYIGYENVSFFYKKFKSYYGCLPGEYRKKNIKN